MSTNSTIAPFNNYVPVAGDAVVILMGPDRGCSGVVVTTTIRDEPSPPTDGSQSSDGTSEDGGIIALTVHLDVPRDEAVVVEACWVQHRALAAPPAESGAIPKSSAELKELFAGLHATVVGPGEGATAVRSAGLSVVGAAEDASVLTVRQLFTRSMPLLRARDAEPTLQPPLSTSIEALAACADVPAGVAAAARLACDAAYAARTHPVVVCAFYSFVSDDDAFVRSEEGRYPTTMHRERKAVALEVLRAEHPVPSVRCAVQLAIMGDAMMSVACAARLAPVSADAVIGLPSRYVRRGGVELREAWRPRTCRLRALRC